MPKCKHFTNDMPLSIDDNYNYVKLAQHTAKNERGRILFVLDYMPKEDLRSGRMLSGATGELFDNLFKVVDKVYKGEHKLSEFSWVACSYNAYKTSGSSQAFKDEAHKEFTKRLRKIIMKYKPDTVVTFGQRPARALHGDWLATHRGGRHNTVQYQNFYGVPVPVKLETKKKSHTFNMVMSISLNPLVTATGKGDPMYLAGYIARNLTNVVNQRLTYEIPKLDFKIRYVNTIEKFDKAMKDITTAKHVGIDTETANLNRICNKLLVIQFSTDENTSYIIPISHMDSPWLPDELKYIRKKLRLYFEKTSKNETNIYANAVFDLNRIKVDIGVRYFKVPVYDVFAAEFALDENMKILNSVTGEVYYSLLNITMQYGCRAYYDSEFGKDKRKTIVNQPLDKPLLTYCALDVITLQHIRKLQIRRAKDIGYDKFNIMVVGQMSDLLHTFSCLEVSGSKVDINWLFFLKSKGSPMMKHKAAVTRKLNETKGVERTNNLLRKKSGAPSTGLFGKAKMSLFKANKRDHLQTLMFKVLKLKPESQGKDGLGKVDKAFQKKYADVPEVALYQELQKVKKLYNSYVKAFVNQWGDDADMRKDGCIRPFYQFRDVVTGRTSAKKPSLHQIPSRNDVSDYIKGVFKNRQDLGKAIKRMFIVDPGRILIKVDYAAHEVRGWSIISGDQKVADVFQHGLDLRTRYKIAPTPALAEKIEYEGDVHKINAAYFFSMDIKDVDKPKRNSVKTVIFGLIYQQGFEGLAASTGQTVQAIKDLTAAFLKRFPIGVGWFDRAKESARKNLFIESPLGRRRNLWGYLIPKSAQKHDGVYAAADRRAVNSPIQGMGSDYLVSGGRCIERLKYEHYRKTKHYPDFFMTNSVHDSLEFSVAYEDFWLAIRLIEEGLTTDVMKVMEKRHNMKFPVALEIDFEVGSNLRDCPGWDYSLKGMEKLIFDALTQQKEELGYAVDPKKVTKRIMTEQYEHMPDWAKKQAWNIGMKMKDMGDDPRSKADRYTKKERRQLEESKEAA